MILLGTRQPYFRLTQNFSWIWVCTSLIPKGDGSYEPFFLISCLCKMMEKMALSCLLYKLGRQNNWYPLTCMVSWKVAPPVSSIKCLDIVSVTCCAFTYLKGVFDRANIRYTGHQRCQWEITTLDVQLFMWQKDKGIVPRGYQHWREFWVRHATG